ncbi:galectin-2-like isoform X2 [Engraulis encrasicolus]|uniref:galectin-2-like isoform X2 n=1 Tax=Engraulis encrasicolus TaxID=184585 RepID=UPI002FD0710F
MECEFRNIDLKAGDQLKIQGKVANDPERFQIDLGADNDNLALHFNPRFQEDDSAIVCNSKHESVWGEEERHEKNPFEPDTAAKIIVKLAGDYFEVELPDGKEIQFPNREGLDIINYVRVKGDFKVTSFKMY